MFGHEQQSRICPDTGHPLFAIKVVMPDDLVRHPLCCALSDVLTAWSGAHLIFIGRSCVLAHGRP
eukprot:7314254-Pyramimonas_sp.AAC.1